MIARLRWLAGRKVFMIETVLFVCGIVLALAGAVWYVVVVVRNLNGPGEAVCCMVAGVSLAVIGKVFFG